MAGFAFVSLVSLVSGKAFIPKKGQIGPFCVCLTCLSVSGRTSTTPQNPPRPFEQTSTNPNPLKLLLGPATCWGRPVPSRPPLPVGQASTLKKRIPPDPLGEPVSLRHCHGSLHVIQSIQEKMQVYLAKFTTRGDEVFFCPEPERSP